jgi:hypothetical protein
VKWSQPVRTVTFGDLPGVVQGPLTGPGGGHADRDAVGSAPGAAPAVPPVPVPDRLPVATPESPAELASRYRALLGELVVLDPPPRQDGAAAARRYRESALVIRDRVEQVWDNVAEPLAAHGFTELGQVADQVRLDRHAAAGRPGGQVPDAGGRRTRGGRHGAGRAQGRPLARGPAATPPPSPEPALSLDKAGTGGRGAVGVPARSGVAGPPVDAEALAAVTADPLGAPARAHTLCMHAMTRAAELRALGRTRRGVPYALATVLACLLAGAAVALSRTAGTAAAVPCLGVAAGAVTFLVGTLSTGGRLQAVRAGLLGAGAAAVAVLATAPGLPRDPSGVISAGVVAIVAVRFGLGLGGGKRARK